MTDIRIRNLAAILVKAIRINPKARDHIRSFVRFYGVTMDDFVRVRISDDDLAELESLLAP